MADISTFIQSLMQLLAGSGPTGYTKDIRQNLGMNVPRGGNFNTSSMTSVGRPNGYTPRTVRPDTKIPLIPSDPVTPVTGPVTPTGPTKPVDPTSMPGYTLVNGGWWPNTLLERRPNMVPGGVNSR